MCSIYLRFLNEKFLSGNNYGTITNILSICVNNSSLIVNFNLLIVSLDLNFWNLVNTNLQNTIVIVYVSRTDVLMHY